MNHAKSSFEYIIFFDFKLSIIIISFLFSNGMMVGFIIVQSEQILKLDICGSIVVEAMHPMVLLCSLENIH